jgi:cysteine desulfurase
MLPFYSEVFWNTSSIHALGRRAARFLESARERCGAIFKRPADDIVFTAGATDGIQICLDSLPSEVLETLPIYASDIEHRSMRNGLRRLALRGGHLKTLATVAGVIDLSAITTAGIYIAQAANSETGILQPISDIAHAVHSCGGFLICDAAQALWKVDSSDFSTQPDAVILSAHKAYGPKGAGLVMLQPELRRLMLRARRGEAQEQGLREGTHNLSAIVGMAATAELISQESQGWRSRSMAARTSFEDAIQNSDLVAINFADAPRLPNTSSVRVYGVDGDVTVLNCGLAISFGSACSSGAPGPSPALLASGLDSVASAQTVRVSFGRDHDKTDGRRAARSLLECATRLSEKV